MELKHPGTNRTGIIVKYLIFSLTYLIVLSCKSETIKINDGKIEKSITRHTGVTNQMLAEAKQKKKLNLGDLFVLAVEQTERIAIRQEALVQAEARKSAAWGGFFPSLSYRHLENFTIPDHRKHDREINRRNEIANALLGVPTDSTSTTGTTRTQISPAFLPGDVLVLNVPIMTGLNEYSAFKTANEMVEVRKYEAQFEAGRLYLELAQLYYNILQLENTITTNRNILSVTENIIKELKYRVQLGKSRSAELYNASSQLAKLEADLQKSEDDLQILKSNLLTKIGSKTEVELELESLPEELKLPMELAMKKSDNRPDVRAAEFNLNAARAEIKRAWGGHLPTVSLNGYYRIPRSGQPRNRDIFTQFVVQIPLLSAGTISSAVKEAESAGRQAEMVLEETKRTAGDEIRTTYRSYVNSGKILEAYKKSMEAAELNYKFQKRDLSQKLATSLDVFNALNTLQSSQNDYSRIQLQRYLYRVAFEIAIGNIPIKKSGDSSVGEKGDKE
ncbi:MAG: TolC family protein [Leptospiraceae bacterium]|nr:TolC family protein [Leptospiraceae bacterium]MCP5510340.1 TolC family protein [Leptospiraceae bacterium]